VKPLKVAEMTVIEKVKIGCSCTRSQAEEYVADELRNLRELADGGDLRYSDFEQACSNLGIDYDNVEFFIEQVGML